MTLEQSTSDFSVVFPINVLTLRYPLNCDNTLDIEREMISIAIKFALLIRTLLILRNVGVFQCTDWWFVSGSYWKNLCFITVMIFGNRSTPSVGPSIMSGQRLFRLSLFLTKASNFSYFEIFNFNFSYCLFDSVYHARDNPNAKMLAFPHISSNFLKFTSTSTESINIFNT